mgnify:CR=1 FL=1
MSCVRAKNLGLQNKSDACPLPVVVSRMTEASCSIRPPWNSGSSAERGMATSRPPPAREVPTGTNRPGRARVLCLPRDPALLAPWARAACLASVGSVPRDRPAACPARAWAASLPASVRCSQPPARGRAVPVPRCLRACSTRWCRALAPMLRAMLPRACALLSRDGAARWWRAQARWRASEPYYWRAWRREARGAEPGLSACYRWLRRIRGAVGLRGALARMSPADRSLAENALRQAYGAGAGHAGWRGQLASASRGWRKAWRRRAPDRHALPAELNSVQPRRATRMGRQ